jgi:methyl-accepting chemotaxis protein
LRHVLIRVLRTSTIEVDRREAPRMQLDLPCRLSAAGGLHRARVIDVSIGGAAVRDAPPLDPGVRGTLGLDGIGVPLPFVVRASVGGVLRMAFELDASAMAALQTWLEDARRRPAA